MPGKLLIGVLVLTIVGAVGVGVYDALTPAAEITTESIAVEAPAYQNEAQTEQEETLVSVEDYVELDSAEAADPTPEAEQVADQSSDQPEVNVEKAAAQPAADTEQAVVAQQDAGQQDAAQPGAVDMVGETWQGTGIIASLEANGVTLTLEDGSTIFLELGPEAYWQGQGVALAAGQQIQVTGFFNGEQYHAATVTTAAQEQIAVRSETGQPLWSGGANSSGNGNAAAANEQAATGEVQVAAEDWLTLSGTITAVNNSTVTFQPADGSAAQSLQLGRADFWQNQGVTLAAGDSVDVLGFWQGTQFKVGQITRTLTDERIMLLDPNGRPLWGGPGRNGNGGNGNSTSGQSTQGQGNQGSGGQGQGSQGQGNGGQGQGNQGNGGQGQGQNQAANLVPAEQWTTLSGNVVVVDPLRLMVQTAEGETSLVNLGQVDFWTEQGYTFTIPEVVTVDGYWLNGQFEAGQITTGGTTLVIRDTTGQLVYGSTAQSHGQGNQGGGRQYRGGRS